MHELKVCHDMLQSFNDVFTALFLLRVVFTVFVIILAIILTAFGEKF